MNAFQTYSLAFAGSLGFIFGGTFGAAIGITIITGIALGLTIYSLI